ncbi:MAG: phosphotransferase family protein [Acidimicrobiaceae bacterium]|nr:phosphotransferase family protein [Acidimicrobiaceae bacterium]MDE0607330.1 phosphotransferase family protein [Acidimicrobiaceae bacterium]
MNPAPTGINADTVTQWILARRPDLVTPLDFELITGGASNLTFKATDQSGTKLVLRRPPTGHILPRAHDMGREHRIISALRGTDVPVPNAIGLCTDDSVNGADFYVMDFVEGAIIFNEADGNAVDLELRPVMANSLTDTLAALHRIDPSAVGLADLGRTDDYCARQLRRWKRQVDDGSDRVMPLFDELHQRLAQDIPPQQGAGIVHGDYRLDNTMMGHDGTVAAVLDWELCTLGDVLADVAGMAMWWGDDPRATGRLRDVPTKAVGFGSRAEMLERYGQNSDRDVSDLPWYVAFQFWRLAAISEGVRVRYAAGAMGDQDGSADSDARFATDSMLLIGDEILRTNQL